MKKILVLFMVVALVRCKEPFAEDFDGYFWTSTADEKIHLYIDGKDIGVLPYLETAPSCDDPASKETALKVHLPSARYVIQLKNSHRESLYGEDLTVHKSGSSIRLASTTSDRRGGSRRNFKGDCLIEELYLR